MFKEYAIVCGNIDDHPHLEQCVTQPLGSHTLVSERGINLDEHGGLTEGVCYSGDRARGRGTFTRVEVLGDVVTITPDYLGTRSLYIADGVISTSMDLMRRVLRALGRKVETDREALAATFLYGNLSAERAPLKGVRLAPAGHRFHVKGSILAEPISDPSLSLMSDTALKHRAIDELYENMAYAASRNDHLLLEMTGGLDSRVTLSLALNMGLKDRISFITRGGAGHPDRVCAERIAHAFDIEFSAVPYVEQVVDAQQWVNNGKDFAGVRWLDDVSFRMRDRQDDYTVLTGGMGEIFRNYFCEVYHYKRGKDREFFDLPMNEEVAVEHAKVFAKFPTAVKADIDATELLAQQISSWGGNVGQALFRQYNAFRNRIHYGGATISRSRFFRSLDPLYTIAGFELAQRKDAEWQLFGEFSFELINEFFPALNVFPLAEKKIAPRFMAASAYRPFLEAMRIGAAEGRPPIPNVARFPHIKREKANDIAREFNILNVNHAEPVFDVGVILEFLHSQNEAKARDFGKSISSPLMFLKLNAA